MATLGCNLQAILSIGMILTKSDVRKCVFDLVTLHLWRMQETQCVYQRAGLACSCFARELKPNLEDHVEAPGNHKQHEGVQDKPMDKSEISDRETNKWEDDL